MKSGKSFISKLVDFAALVTFVTLFALLQKILMLCPPVFKAVNKRRHKYGPMAKTGYAIEDYAEDFPKFSTLSIIFKRQYQRVFLANVRKGSQAPNPKVLSSDGNKEHNLLDFAKPGRPLVLNFGSCS